MTIPERCCMLAGGLHHGLHLLWRYSQPADRVLVTGLLLTLPMLFSWGWNLSSTGPLGVAIGTPNGTLWLPLDEDKTLTVHGPLGDSVIVIHDHQARFASSPCRRQYCVHSGWLHRPGSFTACVPNHITLTLASADKQLDAINY